MAKFQYDKIVGSDLMTGAVVADKIVDVLFEKVDEALTVIETMKKIPDYQAELAIELSFQCHRIKALSADPRVDDWALGNEEEPKSLNMDNCMTEKIDIQPQPMISIGTIDLKKHFKTLGAGNTRMKSSISQMKKEQYAGKSSTITVTSIDKAPLRRGDTLRRGIPGR